MATPDIVFDLVLFGALLLAAMVDRTTPTLAGGALLVVTGVWTYLSAMDLSDWLRQRRVRAHESLLTSLAISVLGIVYYTTHWRARLFTTAGENLVLLVLSIVLMMTALMAAISVMTMVADWRFSTGEWVVTGVWSAATVTACYYLWNVKGLHQEAILIASLSACALVISVCVLDAKRLRPVVGLIATCVGAIALGLAASCIVLLAMPSQKPYFMFILFAAAFLMGKTWMSRRLTPIPQAAPNVEGKPTPVVSESVSPVPSVAPEMVVTDKPSAPPAPAASPIPFPFPLRGWILPRFAAVLMLAPVLLYLVEVLSVER
ncbi:MAG: hypothetical protein NZT92_03870 [Abditibacteriales bacterium]|nr:hypothetical protein [Abditibacteriales bacterium]MDW8365084.1 hypothetical protein [Abditibacteriales bacterium]